MRILVCGSRYVSADTVISRELARFTEWNGRHILIHGAAPGIDTSAARVARRRGWEVLPFPAEWTKYGNAAGPIRNQQMLDEGKPDLVLVFHTDPGLGRGTADMVRRARAAGIPVEVHIL